MGCSGAGGTCPGVTHRRQLTEGEPGDPLPGVGWGAFPSLPCLPEQTRGPSQLFSPVWTPLWPFAEQKKPSLWHLRLGPKLPSSRELGRLASPPLFPRLRSGPALAFLLGVRFGMQLLGHMANLRLPFKNQPNCFPKRLHHFAICQQRGRKPAAPSLHQHLLGSVCLVTATPVHVNGPSCCFCVHPAPTTGDAKASRFMSCAPPL